MSVKVVKSCKNCKFGEIDDKYHGFTHCKLFDVSMKSSSACRKHIKE